MTTLIIARHGNTFDEGETVLRVGARTDLPLSNSGQQQARRLGHYLKAHGITPAAVFCSELIRTKQTAEIALNIAGLNLPVQPLAMFNEVDYGMDDGKPEADVVTRLGVEVMNAWDSDATVPDGWQFNPDDTMAAWQGFANHIQDEFPEQTVMVVSSNGITRFAPSITGDFVAFTEDFQIKLATGAIGTLTNQNGDWTVTNWNVKP